MNNHHPDVDIKLPEYLDMLKAHDWHWRRSDDRKAFEQGKARQLELAKMSRVRGWEAEFIKAAEKAYQQ